MNIQLIRLADGIEIIGDVVESNSEYLLVNKPLIVHYRYYVGGLPSVYFSRFMMFSVTEEAVMFQHRQVTAIAKARQAAVDFYSHSVEDYYSSVEKAVDTELTSAITPSVSTNKEQALKKLLEAMPIDKAVVN